MDMDRARKAQEREILRNLITQWNANRLDLFELSEPNEELEFHGVMRFYFQDAGQKVATKCIRVSSTAVAQAVIKTLIEKFRPDMRMLSIPEYALYEIHENGEERKLGEEEKPLLVQLNWHKDDREGRFLLRRMDEKTYMTPQHFEDEVNFKRKLSKREKKEKKKKEKLLRLKENEENKDGLAERLYTELPETSFTRSISNPEAVMRRRRQQKLEKKLQQFRSRDGGPDSGGTLRIYGESLCKDVPYKTLLLSVRDNAAHVVKEMLNKYALDKEDAANYCLVQSIAMGEGENKEFTTPGKEYILDDDECPLAILMNYQHPVCGSVTFHVRRRPADYQPRKRKKKPKPTHADGEYRYDDMIDRLPYLIELNPDGSEIVNSTPRRHHLHLNVTEVGSERAMSTSGQYLQLFGPNVQPRHCVVAHTDGIVTVTPCSRNAETYVHSQRIFETTILQHGMVVRFGKIHNFRFIDPMLEERRQRHESASGQLSDFQGDRHSTKDDSSLQTSVLETTFDGDHVETVSTSSQKDDRRSEKSDKIKERPLVYDRYEHRRGHDPILPAVLEFREDGEDPFLRVIITNVEPNQVQFKLAPTYSLYMSARFRASTHYRPDITPTERAHRLTNLMNKVAAMIQHVIQEKYTDANALAFWMANASELLHFLKQDRHVSAYTLEAQDLLADSVQVAFRNLVQCLQADLQMIMPAFVDDRDDINEDEGTTAEFLAVLSAAMSLLRRCRVNAALTIQLFSQLFHFVNMWLFNKLVCESRPNYCTRLWGVRLKRRLSRIELWAEKQGLELAADCHLSRVAQTAHLLQSPKSSPDDIATISSTCFKLNSLQLRAVLEKYQPVMDEPRIPQELVENVVKVAENTADELARTDGREVRLEEDPDLQLPFLLPEDGYSCDIVRGVPAGLQEFLHPLQQAGLCRLTIQPTSSGYWTIYMSDQDITRATQLRSASSLGQHGGVSDLSRIGKEPEIAVIKLQKSNNGMGLSIVAAKGVGQEKLGIYIKSVVKGGAADADGRLQAGDQLLKVDGQSLVGITQEKAAEYMTRTGSVVTLEVAKQGAIYHGLATLLSQPSPVMQRGGPQVQEPTRAPSSGNLKVPQEVFNPGYSRTSSTTSIAKAHEQMPPSRDGTIRSNGPMYAAENQRGRPVSQPNLQQQEERFYQNISLYQQKDSNMKMSPQYAEYQQHQQQVPPSPKSPIAPYDDYNAHHPQQPQQQLPPKPLPHDGYVQQQQAQPQQPAKPAPYDEYGQHPLPSPKLMPQGQYDDRFNRGMRGSQSSLHRTEPNAATVGRERPMSALVSQRERDQFMGNGPPGVQADDRQQPAYHSMRQLDQNGKPYDPRSPNMQNGRYPDGYYGEDGARMDPRMAGPGGRPVGMESQNGEPRRSEADYLRQQAKMEEMREEVRRREERNQRDIQVRQTATWNGNANMHASPHHQQPPMRPPPTHANKPMPPNAYPQPPPQHVVDQQGYNTNYGPHGPFIAQGFNNKMPPPNLKPKPYVQGPEKPQRQYPAEGPPNVGYPPNSDIPPERPPLPDEANLYRDSPPPPPPPPVSTHPLVQQQQQQRSVSMQNGINYRYGPPERQGLNDQYGPRSPVHASDIRHHSRPANQPPRVSFDTRLQDPAAKGFSNSLDTTTTPISPSPWEREEREKERKNRLADARRLRDQEIQALEACSYRTPKQEERMRTLRLEQEFQRRAEELKTNDDEDDNEEDDDISERRGVLRMVQEDMERNRLRRLERENEERLRQQQQQQQQQHHHQQHENPFGRIDSSGHNHRATLGRPELPSSNHNTDDWLRRQQDIKNQRKEQREEEERQRQQKVEEDRIRQQKLEEVRRKREQEKAAMRELQAAREAEDRLIREAQRRQEEDLKLRAMQQHHQQQIQQQQQQQIQQQQQQQMQQQQQQQMQQQQSPYHYGGEYNHSPASPTAYGSYPQQYPPSSNYQPGHNSSPSSGAAQRLDNLLTSGQPTYGHVPVEGPARTSNHIPGPNQQHPEKRHDSENAAVPNSNTEVPPVPPTNSIPRSAVSHSRNEAAPPKRVSFHDAKLETLCDDNDDDEEEEEEDESSRNQTNSSYSSQHTYNTDDPSMLLTPSNPQQLFSTGNSPGVIGAQEVYRDPRNKIQAQRQSQMPKLPGPEKLSFKEKMKMFALETGDTESPSDKVKISRAQREIETNINGS